MGTILYFIPKPNSTPVQSDAELEAAGIACVGPGKGGGQSIWTTSGPGGLSGAIFAPNAADGSAVEMPAYDAAKQRWRKHPSGKYWAGVWTDDPPTPEALLRDEPIRGGDARLADGHVWDVPVCVPAYVRGMGGMTLPMRYDLSEADELIAVVRDEYKGIADRCHGYYERYVGLRKDPEDREAWTRQFNDDVSLAVDLLALNYRVGRFEAIAVLGLLGDREFVRVLNAAIEAEAIQDAIDQLLAEQGEKKSDPAAPPAPASGDASGTSTGGTGGASASSSATPN